MNSRRIQSTRAFPLAVMAALCLSAAVPVSGCGLFMSRGVAYDSPPRFSDVSGRGMSDSETHADVSPRRQQPAPHPPRTVSAHFHCNGLPDKPLPAEVTRIAVVKPIIEQDSSAGFGAIGRYQADFSDVVCEKLIARLAKIYPNVEIVRRDESMAHIANEARRRELGMVDGAPSAPLPTADAFVEARISWKTQQTATEKTKLDGPAIIRKGIGAAFGGRDPSPDDILNTRTEHITKMSVTVNCVFSLYYANSGIAHHSYAHVETHEEKTKENFFGWTEKGEADFKLAGTAICELIEKHISAFVEPLVGGDDCTARFRGPNAEIAKAVTYFNHGEFDEAIEIATDEHNNGNVHGTYLLGIIEENMRHEDAARGWYTEAIAMAPSERMFQEARDRLDYRAPGTGETRLVSHVDSDDGDEYGVDR